MTEEKINEALVRKAPQSTEALLELLFEGLGWPRPSGMEIEDIPLLDWSPDELHLNPNEVARLRKIQQLPNLTAKQPFGVFILSFDGGRLPVGAVRRVVDRLVRKRRARTKAAKTLWDLNDLIFFCQSSNGVGTLHVVAFRDTDSSPVMKVISWDTKSVANKIELISSQNLPALAWPEKGQLDTHEWRDQWMNAFTAGYREGIKSSSALAAKMAEVARVVRDEVIALYAVETQDGPLRQLFDDVKKNLRADLTPDDFADMYAQTMVYGLLTARITHPEDFEADAINSVLKFENPFLDALYSGFKKQGDKLFDVDEFGLHDLAELLARTNMDEVLADFGTAEKKDDPVVFFYEEFLEQYDPEQRKALGAYYTPIPIVRFMVRAVDEIIKKEFGLPLGVADQTTWSEYSKTKKIKIPSGVKPSDKVVRMIDPATGTGTFLLEWMRQAERNLRANRSFSNGTMKAVVEQMDALEISLSSYAVAHLKASLELSREIRSEVQIGIRLADSLAGATAQQLDLFEADPIAQEGLFAEKLKFSTNHTVIIGNPPYKDKAKGMGPIVEQTQVGSNYALLDDFTPSPSLGLGAHTKILRNLYVYFWRWALDKAFGTPQSRPGVVAFITSAAWLRGPVFESMRSVIREGNSVWVIDLNGDLKTRIPGDENVFAGIQLPTAICIVVKVPTNKNGKLRFQSWSGTRGMKFERLEDCSLYDESWVTLDSSPSAPIAEKKSSDWEEFISLGDLMPFQANGIHQQRTWVNDASRGILKERWAKLASSKKATRAELMKETSSRNVGSHGEDLHSGSRLGPLNDRINSEVVSIVRYAFRTLDRQWLIADSRVIDRPSPELWQVRGPRQVFFNELHSHPIGEGPSIAITALIPNLDHFHGRGGRVLPVFRDKKNSEWNLLPGLLKVLNNEVDSDINEATLIAYIAGICAFPAFSSRFAKDLKQGGIRIPISLDRELINEVADLGSKAIELFTYCERTLNQETIKSEVRLKNGPSVVGSRSTPTYMPDVGEYDEDAETLCIGDLVIAGVAPSVWNYQVSGMMVVKKWIGYRKASPSTKWSSPLNEIVTESWPKVWTEELLDLLHVVTQLRNLETAHQSLLDRVISGPTLANSSLEAAGLLPPPKHMTKPSVQDRGLLS